MISFNELLIQQIAELATFQCDCTNLHQAAQL